MPLSELPVFPLPFDTATAPSAAHHHVIVPYAALNNESCQHVLQGLALPQLESLMQALSPLELDEGADDSTTPPHERAVARLWGLNPQAPAWAALANAQADSPCAWFSLCHWTAGADQVRMDDPARLPLDMHDARALHSILQPWFAQDGFTLTIVQPGRWLISGAALQDLSTASMDRVLLRDVTAWLPDAHTARQLHRLHSEVQMLLYTHAFNQDRSEHGLQPINAFWLHGAGSLSTAQLQQPRPAVQVLDGLRQATLRQHWPAWKQAWEQADAGPLAELARHVAAGGQATLTLCGERHARSYTTAPRSLLQKIRNVFSPQRFAGLHQAL